MARMKKMAPGLKESQIQALLIDWWASYCRTRGLVDERLLMASAGGAVLGGDARLRAIRSANLRRQGYRNGTPDLFLAVPKGNPMARGEILFSGLFIELKRAAQSKPTQAQLEMADLLRRRGYCVVIACGFEEAQRAIIGYVEKD